MNHSISEPFIPNWDAIEIDHKYIKLFQHFVTSFEVGRLDQAKEALKMIQAFEAKHNIERNRTIF
jgi:hypothetical protein